MSVLLLALSVTLPGFSQSKGADASSATALGPTQSGDYSKEAYVVERYFTRVVMENDGSGIRELTSEVKMLAEAGVKTFAVLSFTYTSANEVVEVDYVRVRKPDGTVIKTPDYNIQDMPGEVTRTAPLYSDVHEKHITVKGLGVGDVLEYEVRHRVVKPEVPGHFWFEYAFAKNVVAKDERLEINVPKEKYVKVVSPEFKPAIGEEGPRRVYRWTHSNLQVKEKDPDEIPKRYPASPSVQMTTFASWEEVGRWYGGLQKEPLELTPALQAKAAELTKGLTTDDAKIRALYSFVALKFHYVGLDFGIGRYQPHAADDVLGNGYGDCKDKHTLLAALLKAAGFEAWPALIHTQRKLDPDVPSPAQFNHVITVVLTGNTFTWLDTTPEVAPYGLLMVPLRDKQALVVPSSAAPVLVKTPAEPIFPQESEFSIKAQLGTDDVLTGHVEQSYRGDIEVSLRTVFRSLPQSQWKDAVQNYSYRLNFAGDVSNVVISPPEQTEKPFEISYDYVRKSYGDWDNHQIISPLPPLGVEVTKDSKEKKPTEPVLLGALGKFTYRSQVELPPGYSMTPASPVNLVEPYAEYHSSSAFENGSFTTTRKFVIKQDEIALSDWESYRKFGRAVGDDEYAFTHVSGGTADARRAGDSEKTGSSGSGGQDAAQLFNEGAEALKRLDAPRAQELFTRLIAVQPNYEGAHLNLAMALAQQQRISEALNEIRKEEDLTPLKTQIYSTGAAIASLNGKKEEAMDQWRRLLKVDPENQNAAWQLGQMLYQAGRYTEEAEVLQAAVDASPGDARMEFALGDSYFRNGVPEKGVPHLRAAVEKKGDDPFMLNEVSYRLADRKLELPLAKAYGEKALNQLEVETQTTTTSEDAQFLATFQLSMVWDTVGWIYFQSGDTKGSESLIRSAWLLGQSPEVGEHLGEIYEKMGRSKEAAHIYDLALAASYVSLANTPGAPEGRYDKLHKAILARYEKLTGRKPSTGTRRLPNGEWSKTPSEELTQLRAVKLAKRPGVSGSAEFLLTFTPGKVESARYMNGTDAVKALTDELLTAHYQMEFPAGSKARILRRAMVSCGPLSGCMAVLVPPYNALPAQH
jgi:tetratricopeptide (TPR) repeat protein/transglutaminase-like putative cysteine protease